MVTEKQLSYGNDKMPKCAKPKRTPRHAISQSLPV